MLFSNYLKLKIEAKTKIIIVLME